MSLRSAAPPALLAFATLFAMTLVEEPVGKPAADMALRMLLLMIVGLFGAGLPLAFAIQELRHPLDDAPLEIDANYRKDDRHFAKSLEKIVFSARNVPAGESVPRTIERVRGDLRVSADPAVTLDIDGNVSVERGVNAKKDIYATGDGVVYGSVRGLKVGGNVTVGATAVVEAWVDSSGAMELSERSNAGARATSLSSIEIDSNGAVFRLLAAPVIHVKGAQQRAPSWKTPPGRIAAGGSPSETPLRLRADGARIANDDVRIAEDSVIAGDLIVHGDLRIGSRGVVTGSVHSDGATWLETNAVVQGSAYAEGDLHIGEGAAVHRHAISRSDLIIGPGGSVGTPGRVTTALADRHVRLHAGSTVYGRVVAGEGGTTINGGSETDLHTEPGT